MPAPQLPSPHSEPVAMPFQPSVARTPRTVPVPCALWGPGVCPRDQGALWSRVSKTDSALWCPLVPAGGVLHRVAALLRAPHLPGQGPHAPRSHQRPVLHVYPQGTGWREGDLPYSRMGGKRGRPREVGGSPPGWGSRVDCPWALGDLLNQAGPKPRSFWGTDSFVDSSSLSSLRPDRPLPQPQVWSPGPSTLSSHPPGSLWTT